MQSQTCHKHDLTDPKNSGYINKTFTIEVHNFR